MDFKRLLIFFVLTMAILLGWEKMYPSPKQNTSAQQASSTANNNTNNASPANSAADVALSKTEPITVDTDTVKVIIDEKTGDLRHLVLNQYKATTDASKPFVLLDNGQNGHQYVAQSVLLNRQGEYLFKDLTFTAPQKHYTLQGDKLEVRLTAAEQNGIQVTKIYTFTKGSYLINSQQEHPFMIALIQRVKQASVTVDEQIIGQIKHGLLVLLGVEQGDDEQKASRLCEKVLGYRIFSDNEGKMNLNVQQAHGEVLVVSQFTLAADTQKGLRPSFTKGAAPDEANRLYQFFIQQCQQHIPTQTGQFAADMQVALINDGPVTFWLQV